MQNVHTRDTSTPTSVSRRTLVKGAAWSLPVVAAAAAVPAWAASLTCAEQRDQPGQYAPLSVKTEVVSMPTYTNVTSSGLPARQFATNSTIFMRTTVTYTGVQPLPAGGKITLACSTNNLRTWTNHDAVATTGAAYLSAPVYDQDVNGPINAGLAQRAAAQFTTIAPLPSGATIVIEWQESVTGSSTGQGCYLFARTQFPDPCGSALLIDRTIAPHDTTAVVTAPLVGVTTQPTFRLIAV